MRGGFLPTLFVVAGSGIALISDFVVAPDLKEGRLVQVLARYRFLGTKGGMFLLYPAAREVAIKLRAFRDFLEQGLRASGTSG